MGARGFKRSTRLVGVNREFIDAWITMKFMVSRIAGNAEVLSCFEHVND